MMKCFIDGKENNFKGVLKMEQTRISNRFQDRLKFYNTANKVCKEIYTQYEFECPICQGQAQAIKESFNGHIRAICNNCDIRMKQSKIL